MAARNALADDLAHASSSHRERVANDYRLGARRLSIIISGIGFFLVSSLMWLIALVHLGLRSDGAWFFIFFSDFFPFDCVSILCRIASVRVFLSRIFGPCRSVDKPSKMWLDGESFWSFRKLIKYDITGTSEFFFLNNGKIQFFCKLVSTVSKVRSIVIN